MQMIGGATHPSWTAGTGSEVMRRIAVLMVGGMISSTVLTLLVIPAIQPIAKGWHLTDAIRETYQAQLSESAASV